MKTWLTNWIAQIAEDRLVWAGMIFGTLCYVGLGVLWFL